MKMVEIKYAGAVKELEKLYARLERAEKTLEKKAAIAEKYGVINWSAEERQEWLKTIEIVDGWIVNKEDIKKNGAYFEYHSAEYDVSDIKRSIEKAERRLEKVENDLEAYHKEVEELADLMKKEELYRLEFEAERKEWLKDGIVLESRYYGMTPSGKRFYIHGNCGMTMRSRHCVTLTINGYTIFTSGEFWRAYSVIKRS